LERKSLEKRDRKSRASYAIVPTLPIDYLIRLRAPNLASR